VLRAETPEPDAPAPAAAEPEPPAEAAPAPAAAASTPEPAAHGLSLVDVRRLWPDLLEAVKLKRRYTWILLSQNAQVTAVDDKMLTIGLINAGARNSFVSGGSEEILRQAAIDVIGQDWRIESIVDPAAQPGANPEDTVRVIRPAVPTEPSAPEPAGQPDPGPAPEAPLDGDPEAASPAEPAPNRRPADPQAVASARGAIQPTRETGAAVQREVTVSDDDVDPDDPDADDHQLGGAQLLERELGARIIEEIKHD
jgi:DNA polymerase-3 subunit gamma/tau